MKKLFLAATALFLALPSYAKASDWEKLCKDGFAVIEYTYVKGEFHGCKYGQEIPLDNGLIFKCSSYDYSYAYRPEFYILKNIKTGAIKFIIDDEEFDGNLYR